MLDKDGAEAVGGVVTASYGVNPLRVILGVHEAIDELAPGLPRKAVIDWSRVSREQANAFASGVTTSKAHKTSGGKFKPRPACPASPARPSFSPSKHAW